MKCDKQIPKKKTKIKRENVLDVINFAILASTMHV